MVQPRRTSEAFGAIPYAVGEADQAEGLLLPMPRKLGIQVVDQSRAKGEA